jgi:hypothetical protein
VRLAVKVLQSYQGASNRVLSAERTREMLTPQGSWIGLGFPMIEEDGKKKLEHPGWNEGYHSLMVGCLYSGQGLVWRTNGAKGKPLGREVMRAIPQGFGRTRTRLGRRRGRSRGCVWGQRDWRNGGWHPLAMICSLSWHGFVSGRWRVWQDAWGDGLGRLLKRPHTASNMNGFSGLRCRKL